MSKSWAELEDRLRRDGIEVSYKTKGSTSQVEGVRFTADNTTFNGSKIDRQFSYSKIDFALRQNLRAKQRERQPDTLQPYLQEQSHKEKEPIISGALGLFDFPDTTPEIDADEEALRRSVQMMIANIRIPEHDNSPVLREIQKLSNANGDYAESQLGWLKAIYAQNKQQKEQEEENKVLIKECLYKQQKLCTMIENKSSTVQLYLLAIVLTVILIATFIYTNY
ncbi:MAG: hypothetical protein SNH28_03220 [Rikenellaceae bacterium]